MGRGWIQGPGPADRPRLSEPLLAQYPLLLLEPNCLVHPICSTQLLSLMTCISCEDKSGGPRLSYNRNSDHTTAQHALQARMTSVPLCWQGKPCIAKRACYLRQYISVCSGTDAGTHTALRVRCPGLASSQARAKTSLARWQLLLPEQKTADQQ